MRLLTTNDPSRSSLPPRHARRAGGLARTRPGREARGARREARESARSAGTCAATPGVARASRSAAPRVLAKRVARHHRIREEDSARWHAGIGGSGGKAPSDADIFFRGCALFTTRRTPARTVIFASLTPPGTAETAPSAGGPLARSDARVVAREGGRPERGRARVASRSSSPRPSPSRRVLLLLLLPPRVGVPPGHPCRRLDGPRVGPPRGDEPLGLDPARFIVAEDAATRDVLGFGQLKPWETLSDREDAAGAVVRLLGLAPNGTATWSSSRAWWWRRARRRGVGAALLRELVDEACRRASARGRPDALPPHPPPDDAVLPTRGLRGGGGRGGDPEAAATGESRGNRRRQARRRRRVRRDALPPGPRPGTKKGLIKRRRTSLITHRTGSSTEVMSVHILVYGVPPLVLFPPRLDRLPGLTSRPRPVVFATGANARSPDVGFTTASAPGSPGSSAGFAPATRQTAAPTPFPSAPAVRSVRSTNSCVLRHAARTASVANTAPFSSSAAAADSHSARGARPWAPSTARAADSMVSTYATPPGRRRRRRARPLR